jgi:hypothetical protein
LWLINPEPGRHARTKVLDKHIGVLCEFQYQFATSIGFHIHGKRSLVSIVVQERRGKIALAVSGAPNVIAPYWRLNLNNVRTLIGKNHGGVWTRDHRREINDPNPIEWTCHCYPPATRSPPKKNSCTRATG